MRTPRPEPTRPAPSIFAVVAHATDKRADCRDAFKVFLRKHVPQDFLLGKGGTDAFQAASHIYSSIQLRSQKLGGRFLGVTLGGPIVHGMGLDLESKLDCRVHFLAGDETPLTELTRQTENFLRSRQYVPCAAPVCDLARRPFTDLVSALSVFSDQIILPADGPDLKRAALSAFKDALGRIESRYQPQLLRVLKERFDRLTASDPAYVVDKFVRSWEPVLPGKVRAPSLRDDKVFIAEMRTIASGPLARRARAFPFPASIEVLFA